MNNWTTWQIDYKYLIIFQVILFFMMALWMFSLVKQGKGIKLRGARISRDFNDVWNAGWGRKIYTTILGILFLILSIVMLIVLVTEP